MASLLLARAVDVKYASRPPCPASLAREAAGTEPIGAVGAGVAQSAEHLFCKQVVRGSSPLASSSLGILKETRTTPKDQTRIPYHGQKTSRQSEGCPSGQREQTVNLPAMPSMVRIHHPPRGSRPKRSWSRDQSRDLKPTESEAPHPPKPRIPGTTTPIETSRE
jgi:hypothetical protein